MRLLRWMLVLSGLVAAVWVWGFVLPVGPSQETFVEVPAGTRTAGIANRLAEAHVIRSRWAFEALRAVKGGSLKAGEYRFEGGATPGQVYSRLRRGDVFTVEVRVPEGYNIFDVAEAVERVGLGPKDAFLRATREQAGLVRLWSPNASSVEGYLFPDTYRFGRRAKPAEMVRVMVKRFAQVAGELGLRGEEGGRVVTLASLVEREVRVAAERGVAAGVFENRLAAGMPLQTDPAVVYASMLRGTWTGVIHQSELHSDSPYNTYVHAGLPPGPICNPGMAALRAAAHPTSTRYLYFVAQADGSTRFAGSLQEHEVNVQEYRKTMGSR